MLSTQNRNKDCIAADKELEKHQWDSQSYSQRFVDCEKVIAHSNEALQINPHPDEAWLLKSRTLLSLGRYEAAIASYDKALRLNPDNMEAWRWRGFALYLLYDEQIAFSEKEAINLALESNPIHPAMANMVSRYQQPMTESKHWTTLATPQECSEECRVAIACYERTIPTNYTPSEAWLGRF
ncbi:tetratricopeptide repeat protein [Leptothermofonsia sp. ETS-13]|uniref:tetratricopeptide repeat protein n=1 Tax=Leptothermofonsia sp. ETS-13 TaxID=3035696 RepID=UPI003BA27478